jgi:hypothetical protein
MSGSALACLFALATFVPRFIPVSPSSLGPDPADPRPARPGPSGSLSAQLDNHVLANLLTDTPARRADMPLTVVAGEVTRCEAQTCTVPLTLRVSGAQGPVKLAFAVANSRGEISDVQHAACGTGACSVSLVLERGLNTVSIGVGDEFSHTSAYTTLHVNATRNVAATPGRTEWF